MDIHPITLDDYIELARVHWVSLKEECREIGISDKIERTHIEREWRVGVKKKELEGYYYRENGVIAGFVCCKGDEIKMLYVSPVDFRQGIATKLIDHLKYAGKYAWVVDRNEGAKKFYEAYGFKPVDETRTTVKMDTHLTERMWALPQPCMIQNVYTAEGEKIDLPFFGSRFEHIETFRGYATLKFQQYNGWELMDRLAEFILYFRPFCIVEIGAGSSTLHLARIAEPLGVKMYSVDKSPRKEKEYYPDHTFYNMMSSDFMKQFDDTPAIVLIDANHSYEAAKKEFEFFFEKLVLGGVIFLHDTFPPHEWFLRKTACHDVWKLRKELESGSRAHEMDVFTWPFGFGYMGLTMVIKKDPGRPEWGK